MYSIEEKYHYTHSDLMKYLNVTPSDPLNSDIIVTNIFQRVCGAKCVARKEISYFQELQLIHVSPSMKPDVSVYNEGEISPVLFAEVFRPPSENCVLC